MNIREPQNITIIDPREFDGDAYQVAQRAIQQLQGLVRLTINAVDPANLMARNAELERQLSFGAGSDELRSAANLWPESPQGRQLDQMVTELEGIEARLSGLERAVAYDPKSREAKRV